MKTKTRAEDKGTTCFTMDGETGRDGKEINHWAPRVWPGGQQRSMRCGAYHELGHQRRLCITDKISCSLETPGRGSGSEGRQRGQENWKQHESACRTSAEFNTALHLAITALRASPDEKTTAQKNRGVLEKLAPSAEGEIETKAKWNPCNPSETWHWLWLQQTGNTDESRKCSRKCKWTCSSSFAGPQICSGWRFGFQSNNLDPSITSRIHPQCQDLSVSHQANARAVREMASNGEGSFLLPLFEVGGGARCVSNPCLVSIVNCFLNLSEEKWRCAEFVVSLYRVATGAGGVFNLAVLEASTHTDDVWPGHPLTCRNLIVLQNTFCLEGCSSSVRLCVYRASPLLRQQIYSF